MVAAQTLVVLVHRDGAIADAQLPGIFRERDIAVATERLDAERRLSLRAARLREQADVLGDAVGIGQGRQIDVQNIRAGKTEDELRAIFGAAVEVKPFEAEGIERGARQ